MELIEDTVLKLIDVDFKHIPQIMEVIKLWQSDLQELRGEQLALEKSKSVSKTSASTVYQRRMFLNSINYFKKITTHSPLNDIDFFLQNSLLAS